MKTKQGRALKVVSAAICLTCLSAVLLAACSSQKESASPPSGGAAPKGPLELSVMLIQQAAEPPKADNPAIKKLQEYTNTKLNFTFVPASAYDDKVSATLATGKMPEVMLIRKNKESAMLNAQLSGAFWDLTPFLKDTKNLSKMSEVAVTNAKVSGKLYGIPRDRTLARYGMIFRKDWLDNLGLQQPKTVDDIYNIAKAFTLNDPDKNGKNDTFGIQEDATMELLKQLTVYNGGPNGWGLKDGKVTPDFLFPEFKSALDLYKKMVSEKLISPDFPIAKKYDYFNQGKAGMYFSVLDDSITRHNDLPKLDPKASVDVAQNFEGPKGQKVRATNGYDSLIALPKQSVTSEAKVKEILGFLDKLAEQPMQDVFAWGVEGVDYTLDNGAAKKKDGALMAADAWNLRWDGGTSSIKGVTKPIEEKVQKLFADNRQIAVVDLSASLVSDTNTQKGADLKKAITDAQTKYILGELDEKGWNDAVDKWRKGGGDKIMEEFSADYNKSNGK
ncbi:extracellular solute-binding protein [Paenibacillus silviterrae]|uniref:extracellular solute-binding protein n=1 Tax=Paenibacillus silviterrae TaxID=3242194 RepID=UPI002543387F|nr:extracellular solute-binding protein [Paenibacillus chinjuensis]